MVRNIEKMIAVDSDDFAEVMALALRSAMMDSQSKLRIIKRVIIDNVEMVNDKALHLLIDEVDNSPFKEENSDLFTDIIYHLICERNRRINNRTVQH